jgi:hypothetical protein
MAPRSLSSDPSAKSFKGLSVVTSLLVISRLPECTFETFRAPYVRSSAVLFSSVFFRLLRSLGIVESDPERKEQKGSFRKNALRCFGNFGKPLRQGGQGLLDYLGPQQSNQSHLGLVVEPAGTFTEGMVSATRRRVERLKIGKASADHYLAFCAGI